MIDDARKSPGEWIPPPIGDPWDSPPPSHLVTKVKTLFKQMEKHYCLTYSFASALYYCGFRDKGVDLSKHAIEFSEPNMNKALEEFKGFMPNHVPPIGAATVYGKRVSGNNRKKRPISWDDLFSIITPYPTLVIPVTHSGQMTHAFVGVDDLIFDSSFPYALKLRMESVNYWIFNDVKVDIFLAWRFNQKVSPPGHKLPHKYTREVTYNWVRDTSDVTTTTVSTKSKKTPKNKSYPLMFGLSICLP